MKTLSVSFLERCFWWIATWVIRAFVLLPYTWQLCFGRFLGRLALHLSARRRHITTINLTKCFPELTPTELQQLLKKAFESLGMYAVEAMIAWWMSPKRFAKIPIRMIGWENYLTAEASGQGVIVCCAHFTCLEIMGRHFGSLREFALVYQAHKNATYEAMMSGRRGRYATTISRAYPKQMIQWLRQGKTLFYAPDQDLGADRSVFAPFFNIATATLSATSKLAMAGHAKLVPVMYNRTLDNKGYELHILPALENFPSDDAVSDASRYNQILESHIRRFPDQYLWAHRRFKSRPVGEPAFY